MSRLIEEGRIIWPETPEGRPRKKAFLNELSDNLPGFSSIIPEGIYTNTATKEVTGLFDGGHWFDFPKPSQLLKQLFSQVTESNDIIMDLFSGSATTAHAVMQLNAEDGGKRQFILVQLPEVCDENSEAYNAGYRTICEIGKERIRRAGAKILAEAEAKASQTRIDGEDAPLPDVGFRVFKLDTTNMKTWDATPIEDGQVDLLVERMYDFLNKVKPKRSDLDVIFEVTLKLGIPLNYPVTQIDLNGKPAYLVTDPEDGGVLVLICLAPHIMPDDIVAMTEYAPGLIVADQESFDDDTAMSNAYFILRDKKVKIKLV